MADGQRRITHGPDHSESEGGHRPNRVPQAAEPGDQHHEHSQERQDGCQRHRRFAAPHLVVFHDGQSRQTELQLRVVRLGEDAAEGIDRFAVLDEMFAVLANQLQQDESVRGLCPKSALIGQRADHRPHVRPGRTILAAGVQCHAQDVAHQPQLPLQRGQFLRLRGLAGILHAGRHRAGDFPALARLPSPARIGVISVRPRSISSNWGKGR